MHSAFELFRLSPKLIEIVGVVGLMKEAGAPVVTALDHVDRHAGHQEAGVARHGGTLSVLALLPSGANAGRLARQNVV
jgi:hypothetical protein